MKTLGVVTCGKKKIWGCEPDRGQVPARQAYCGTFSRLAREYAEKFTDQWVFLSAKYGFLAPDTRVCPYDVTFNHPRDPRYITTDKLREQVRQKGLDKFKVVIVIAGSKYVKKVRDAFQGTGIEIQTPLKGKGGIGSMQKWLKQKIKDP